MIFSELYSAYYNAIAAILTRAVHGETDESLLQEAVMRHAFSESVLTILPSLKSEKWQLLHKDMTTPIRNAPSMPLTVLEKRWLKAISLDHRIRLFDVNFEGIADVEPLFTPDDYVVYDQYADGDPYLDEGYITRFRMILKAIREKQPLSIEMVNRKGCLMCLTVLPIRLEYSEKDDKFRLISAGDRRGGTINLARIVTCKSCPKHSIASAEAPKPQMMTVMLKIVDQRNALERCMLHFAHFEKQAERLEENRYLVHIRYHKDDETEMLIRILGFGPLVEVIEPDAFRRQIAERLMRQKSCELL